MGRCVFVTGGSSGIGLAAATELAARGWAIGLFARDRERLGAAAEAIRRKVPGVRVAVYVLDVADLSAVGLAIAEAVAELGAPRRVILSAGMLAMGEADAMDMALHRRVMEVNHFGSLAVIQAVLPHMARGSDVGLVGSAAGVAGLYGYSAYVASKFALRGLAEVLRVELAPRGIGVTICLPPDTETPMLHGEKALRHPVAARMAAGARVMSAEAVAGAMIRGMERGRFVVLSNAEVQLLYLFAPFVSAWMRWRQIRLLRRCETSRHVSGDVRE